MSTVVIVGSGAGGATVARELAGRHEVLVIEAGGPFRRFHADVDRLGRLRPTGAFFDERLVSLLFPAMRIRRAVSVLGGTRIPIVFGATLGGSTPLTTGTALRCDEGLRAAGIDLDAEFTELARQLPVTTAHRERWGTVTRRLFDACEALGLSPRPLPKLGNYSRCRRCGRCILGCPYGAKWDARRLLDEAVSKGAKVFTGWTVDALERWGDRVVGVRARRGLRRRLFAADVVVLAAGGLGTPALLERSGIDCEPRLFVDPVLCVAAPMPGAGQDREMTMPFVVQRDGCIVSPYMDWLSFFFDRRWRLPAGDIVSLMIKLADDDRGRAGSKRIEKDLTDADRARLAEASALCGEILERVGAPPRVHVFGILNAGHPGGALPVRPGPSPFHDARLPENVWVADASLLPESLGRPAMLTIMAMAKRVSRLIDTRCQAPHETLSAASPPATVN